VDPNVAYMPSSGKIHDILNGIQKAAVPEVFGVDFMKDMGFTSSNDRAMIRVLRYLGMIDSAGRPQSSYREFMDHTKAKTVLAARLRTAFDDLFASNKDAQAKTAAQLKGWFKTKTGAADTVAEKMAYTFKSLADYADWTTPIPAPPEEKEEDRELETDAKDGIPDDVKSSFVSLKTKSSKGNGGLGAGAGIGLVYRLEIHLPDSPNIDTFRAIFKALREELM
jgi:hypothetical protein